MRLKPQHFGISLGYLWDIFGISLEYLWNIFWISLGYLWDVLEISWEYLGDIFGISWVHWFIGPLVHWSLTTIGLLDHKSIGPLVHYSISPLVHWSIGPVQMSLRLNFCRSVPPEFLRSFFAIESNQHWHQFRMLKRPRLPAACHSGWERWGMP